MVVRRKMIFLFAFLLSLYDAVALQVPVAWFGTMVPTTSCSSSSESISGERQLPAEKGSTKGGWLRPPPAFAKRRRFAPALSTSHQSYRLLRRPTTELPLPPLELSQDARVSTPSRPVTIRSMRVHLHNHFHAPGG
ncbi:hypothetical protein H4582DRAFT_482494 [Lactarius indigo]|nr:hypothetical protein H4582DRAFT_482494 [Lactarius indigo]